MRRNIYLDVLFLTGATGVMALCQWLLLSYTARTWGVSISGEYAFALSVMTPLFLLIYQSYRTIIITNDDENESEKIYFRFRLLINIFVFALFSAFFLVDPFEYSQARYGILFAIFLIKTAEGFSDLSYGVLQKRKDGRLQAASIILRCITGFFMFWIFALIFEDFIMACLGVAISWFAVFLVFDKKNMGIKFYFQDLLPKKNDFHLMYEKFKIAAPLIFASVAGALIYNVPRYAIDHQLGVEELGYYSILTSFSIAINLACAAMGQAIMPWLVSAKKNRNQFYKISIMAVGTCFLMSLCTILIAWCFGNEVLNLFFGIDDSVRDKQFLYLMILMSPLYIGQILSFINNSIGYFNSTFYITLALGVFVGFSTNYFVGGYQLYGAGVIMAFIGVIQIIGYSLSIRYGLERTNAEQA